MAPPNTRLRAISQEEVEQLRSEVAALREEVAQLKDMIAEVIDLFAAAKGAFRLFGWIGSGVKWSAGLAAAVGALWVMLKGGFPPTK